MIERLIDRPNPMRSGLLVTNGSKMGSADAPRPGPVSATFTVMKSPERPSSIRNLRRLRLREIFDRHRFALTWSGTHMENGESGEWREW